MSQDLLDRLQATDPAQRIKSPAGAASEALTQWQESGVRFVASSPAMEGQYYRALGELLQCIKPTAGSRPILNEGGVYQGCWIESTGTISAELLSRFLPEVAGNTFAAFAAHQRDDGLFPYKLTADGAAFSQIQIVSPLARSVWTHHGLNGGDTSDLRAMYDAMARNDAWLATHRDTRGTGGVEAFCTFDTGHDLSGRFWHVPDSPFGNDPARFNPDNPILPFVAPDLTANVACQRNYLARIAEALGEDGSAWRAKASQSLKSLFEQCYDPEDGFFYDRDAGGRLVRVQSDVLLRVLACEVGDDDFFAAALSRYLLNTRKFFAKYPFTSMALDDPRFDPAFEYNSWSGPTNLLSLIRAPHAFEAHGRHVELTWVLYPILSALFRVNRFAQTLHPFTGREGFTEVYSPAIVCLLDFVERLCGIQPRPDGTVWFTGLVPYQIDHRDAAHETAYARRIEGAEYTLLNTAEEIYATKMGQALFRAPKGIRVITARDGTVRSIVGMSVQPIAGQLETSQGRFPFRIHANQQLDLVDGAWILARDPGLVRPTY